MRYALAFTWRAEAQVTRAVNWYELERLGRGRRFLKALSATIADLAEFPNLGAPAHRSLRCLSLKRYPYTIYYRVSAGTIEIHGCIHQRKKPDARWRRRIREAAPLSMF